MQIEIKRNYNYFIKHLLGNAILWAAKSLLFEGCMLINGNLHRIKHWYECCLKYPRQPSADA